MHTHYANCYPFLLRVYCWDWSCTNVFGTLLSVKVSVSKVYKVYGTWGWTAFCINCHLLFLALQLLKNIKRAHKLSVCCPSISIPQRKGESHRLQGNLVLVLTHSSIKVTNTGRFWIWAMHFGFFRTDRHPENQHSPEESLFMEPAQTLETHQRSDNGRILMLFTTVLD